MPPSRAGAERAYLFCTATWFSWISSYTLADLGLRRADIPFVVYCKAREQAAAAQGKPLRSAGKGGDSAIHAT